MDPRNWSDLPPDLLRLISSTLTVPDLVRFSSVCTSWRSTASPPAGDNRQSPWLVFASSDEPTTAKFYNPVDNSFYSIPNQPSPPISTRIFIGSDFGWLITVDEVADLYLLNPLTRRQIPFPPASTFDHVTPHRRCRFPDGPITSYTIDPQYQRTPLYLPRFLFPSHNLCQGLALLLAHPNRRFHRRRTHVQPFLPGLRQVHRQKVDHLDV